jgi:carbon storage regulator
MLWQGRAFNQAGRRKEMLVLTRKRDEVVSIGDEIEVVVLAIHGNKVRLGFVAPESVTILRKEIAEKENHVD